MKLDKYTVGKRYGKALFELAVEENATQPVYQELLSLRAIYQETPDLGELLSDVRLDVAETRQLMDLLSQNYQGLVKNFLEVVFRYKRMNDLLFIIAEYEKLYDESQGVVAGTVTTAVPLTAEQKTQLSKKIARRFDLQKAELTEQVDPAILGGVIVEVNHQVIDGSVKSRLEKLRNQLRG